jgi:hypothetical protein
MDEALGRVVEERKRANKGKPSFGGLLDGLASAIRSTTDLDFFRIVGSLSDGTIAVATGSKSPDEIDGRILEQAITEINDEYQKRWERNATVNEIVGVFAFSVRPCLSDYVELPADVTYKSLTAE